MSDSREARPEFHPLLQRQMRRVCREASVSCASATPEAVRGLMQRVSSAYADFDRELYLLERSQEISSREMLALHAQLRASEARHANLVSLSSDWIWETDAKGRLIYVTAPADSGELDFNSYLGVKIRVDMLPPVPGSDPAVQKARILAREPFRNFTFGMVRSNGELVYLRISGEPFQVDGVFAGYRGVASDVTRASINEQAVNQLARFDGLTGLPNRTQFMEQLKERIAQAGDSEELAVMFLDLDRFKLVNDTLGHAAGDRLLKIISGRLQHALREDDVVSRLGGDEFVFLINRFSDVRILQQIAQRILDRVALPVPLQERSVQVSGSIGIAIYPRDGFDADALLKHADGAMYVSKGAGKNTWRFFTSELAEQQDAIYTLEEELRRAVVGNQMRLFFQPLFQCGSGELTSVEALIRWEHPTRGILSPDAFLGLAEDTGLILPLGRWVIRAACQQVRSWRDAGVRMPYCSVNLSQKQLANQTLVEDVRGALEAAGLEGGALEVEITESQVMADPEGVQDTLAELRAMGVRVAIDDFGTGYSSLSYLKKLSASTLKVDRSFVRGLPEDKEDVAILKAVLALGHSVGMEVVAEGVETEEQLALLTGMGCDRVQGYLLGRPHAADSINERFGPGILAATG